MNTPTLTRNLRLWMTASLLLMSSLTCSRLYATVYYVATNGNNSANGTNITTPWATIGMAATNMVSGDTVYIRGGVYRETVIPNTNTAPGLITYQAYSGETPVISGADVKTGWTLDTGNANVYKLPWTLSLLSSTTNAAYTNNYIVLRPEMVIFDGQVMHEVTNSPSNLIEGTFWVQGTSTNPAFIYAKFPGDADPTTHLVEAATRTHLLYTNAHRINNLVINGLTFRYACNTVQDPMVRIGDLGATNILFESNIVEWANSGGINFGGSNNTCACNIVQNNGEEGFSGSGNHLLFDGNQSLSNNWKGYNVGFEGGGGKWTHTSFSIFRNHTAAWNTGPGIWFDETNQFNLIEKCTVLSNSTHGIFLEKFSGSNTVQDNVVFGTGLTPNDPNLFASGIAITDSTNNYILNNTVYGCLGNGLFILWDNRDVNGGVALSAGYNKIYNNIFAFNSLSGGTSFGEGHQVYISSYSKADALTDTHDGNVFWQGSAPGTTFVLKDTNGFLLTTNDLGAWQAATGQDSNSIVADPLLVNSSNIPGFHLSVSSPARSLGVTSPITNAYDFDGEPRPSPGGDAGADQFTTGELHYTFDESSGPALDSGITPLTNGTFVNFAGRTNNTPWGASPGSGFALDLSHGTNDWVSTGPPAKINNLTNITLTAWVNLRGNPTNDDRLIDMITATPAGGFGLRIIPRVSGTVANATNLQLALQVNGISSEADSGAPSLNLSNHWVFLAVTYSGANSTNNVSFYEGDISDSISLISTQTRNSGPLLNSTNQLRIGSTQASGADRTPPIWIDDVRVYNRVLTADDLEELRTEPEDSSLQLRYTFDETGGLTTPALDTGVGPAANCIFTNQATRTNSTPSGYGSALDLSDGSSDWVSTPAPAKLNNNNLTDLTLTTWINLRGEPAKDDRLVDMITASPAAGGFGLRIITNGATVPHATNFQVALQVNGLTAEADSGSTPLNASNRWLFLAVTYAGGLTSANVNFYQGDTASSVSLISTQTRNSGALLKSTNDFRIGSTAASGSDRTPPVWIDDVRVYNRVLSQTELEQVRLQAAGVRPHLQIIGGGGSPPPVIVEPPAILDDGHFHAGFVGLPAASYTIEYAPSVEGPWQTLTIVTSDDKGYFDLDDPTEPGNRFYRVLKTP